MRVKVYKGTPQGDGESLCGTCRHSMVIRGRRLDEEIVRCHASAMRPIPVTFKVTSCSSYSDERLPGYMQMMETAWILRPSSRRRAAGFIRARDLRDDERDEMLAEIDDPLP